MPLGTQVPNHATTYEIVKEGSGEGIKARQNATVHARGEIAGKKVRGHDQTCKPCPHHAAC